MSTTMKATTPTSTTSSGYSMPIQFDGISFEGKSFPKTSDKILIVGAGPSGLHMGHLLRKKGYTNIRFYEESEDRINGNSVSIPHRAQKDVVHELGACYMHPAYDEVRNLLKELNEKAHNGVDEEVHPVGHRIYARDQPNLENYFSEKKPFIELEPWIFATIEREVMPKAFWWLPEKLFAASLYMAVERYCHIYRELLGDFNYNLLPNIQSLAPEKYEKMRIPFLQFLQDNELTNLVPLLGYAMTSQGYGTLQTVPTYYAMMWITPNLLRQYVSLKPTHPKKAMLRHGFQNIWETIVQVNNFDITFNCHINSIVRSEKGVKVTGTCGQDNRDLPQEEFDYLIVACVPQKNIIKLDWSLDEDMIFSKLQSCIFNATLFERGPDQDLHEHISFWPEFLIGEKSGKGEVFACRDSVISMKGEKRDDFNQVREQICYQFWDERGAYSVQSSSEAVDRFAIEQGIPAFKVLQEHKFNYFYHFKQAELDQGYTYRILDLQGRNKTLFVHGGCHFDSILDIIKYNNMLVDAFLPVVSQ